MIAENLLRIKSDLPSGIGLVAVSKFHPVENLMEAYNCGQRVFGESRPQELFAKVSKMPKDVQWHFIGHLQTNKLKLVLPYVSLVHSVDSIHLFNAIDNFTKANELTVNILLEVFISHDADKQGFTSTEVGNFLRSLTTSAYFDSVNSGGYGIKICGLMGMASLTNDEAVIEMEFSSLKMLFDSIKSQYSTQLPYFNMLSMGMTSDYKVAIRCGSNIVRIGTAIFGERE